MNIWDWLARRQLGSPPPGAIERHPAGSFPFEEGAELTGRLEQAFGDLSRLTCLDLGCGPGESVIARQVLEIPWRRLISVEAFLPYIYQLRQKTARAARHDINEMPIEAVFAESVSGEADVVLLIDVLEHFKRREALRLLVRLESWVNRGIVIFSPLGKVPQEDLDGNYLQRHRSTWQPEDWSRLGYRVEVYENLHGWLTPPASAAWAIKTWDRGMVMGK